MKIGTLKSFLITRLSSPFYISPNPTAPAYSPDPSTVPPASQGFPSGKSPIGTSLVVHCLRLSLPMQEVWVWPLIWELGSQMPHVYMRCTHTHNRSNVHKFNKDYKWSTPKKKKQNSYRFHGREEGLVLIFSCENSKIITNCWTTVDRRMLDPSKNKIPHIQGKWRSPSKMVGGPKPI